MCLCAHTTNYLSIIFWWTFGVMVNPGCHNKTPQTGWLKQQKCIFYQSWRLEVPDQGANWSCFWWGLSSRLVYKHLLVFMWSFLWKTLGGEREAERALWCLLQGHWSCSGQGPILLTSFNVNYSLRGPISKYSHTRVRASTYEYGGTHSVRNS